MGKDGFEQKPESAKRREERLNLYENKKSLVLAFGFNGHGQLNMEAYDDERKLQPAEELAERIRLAKKNDALCLDHCNTVKCVYSRPANVQIDIHQAKWSYTIFCESARDPPSSIYVPTAPGRRRTLGHSGALVPGEEALFNIIGSINCSRSFPTNAKFLGNDTQLLGCLPDPSAVRLGLPSRKFQRENENLEHEQQGIHEEQALTRTLKKHNEDRIPLQNIVIQENDVIWLLENDGRTLSTCNMSVSGEMARNSFGDGVAHIAAGSMHTVVLTHRGRHREHCIEEHGEIFTVGDARHPEHLGRSTKDTPAEKFGMVVPVTNKKSPRFVQIDCCGTLSAALTDEGHLYVWGETRPTAKHKDKLRKYFTSEDGPSRIDELKGRVMDFGVLWAGLVVLLEEQPDTYTMSSRKTVNRGRVKLLHRNEYWGIYVWGENIYGELLVDPEKTDLINSWTKVGSVKKSANPEIVCGPVSTFLTLIA